jgi:signal transduction histidine kinase
VTSALIDSLQPGFTVLGAVLAGLFFWHTKDVRGRGFGWLGVSLVFYVLNRISQPSWPLATLTVFDQPLITLASATPAIAAFLVGLAIYSKQWRDHRWLETVTFFIGISLVVFTLLLVLLRPTFTLGHFVPALVMGVGALLQLQAYRDTQDRNFLLLTAILASHPLLWMILSLAGVEGLLIQKWLSLHYVATCIVILSGTLRRSSRELRQTNHALRELNATLESRVAEREREIRIVQDQITRTEVERSRTDAREQLLAELHEGLGSSLSLARVRLATGEMSTEDVRELLDQCFADLHLIIDTLNEHSDGLQSALIDYRWRCERRLYGIPQKIDWILEVDSAPELEPRIRLNVLRIVQEALSNALKHAQAKQITISARYVPVSGICIEIEDDGCGVDLHAKAGSGLRNMEKRAQHIGSELRIENRLDQLGTRVFLCIPVDR